MELPLYRPKDKKAPFGILPWSACVIVQTMAGPVLYYEGGAYTRSPDVLPCITEFENYARIAAGRAKSNYPTIARQAIGQNEINSDFVQVGVVTIEANNVIVTFV